MDSTVDDHNDVSKYPTAVDFIHKCKCISHEGELYQEVINNFIRFIRNCPEDILVRNDNTMTLIKDGTIMLMFRRKGTYVKFHHSRIEITYMNVIISFREFVDIMK